MLTRVIASQLRRTATGPMWHGPSLDEALRGVTPAEASARPIADAHSIWELVLHVSVWAEIARERLDGRSLETPPPEIDFPTPDAPSAETWQLAIDRMHAAYEQLALATEALPEERLREKLAVQQPHSVRTMLHGVIEHGTYHAGQIAILRKALQSSIRGHA